MSYDHAGWLEDHATDASRTGEATTMGLERNTELLDASQGASDLGHESALRDRQEAYNAFDALLERTYRLLNRPKLHSHHCRRCSLLRPCLQQPCHFRALDCEDQWICGECVAGEEPR